MKYAFIREHQDEFSVLAMCRVLKINRSGFYAWLKQPLSNRAIEDSGLLTRIKEFYVASGGTYGSPWIHRDLRETGESCSVNRVAKIMRQNSLRAQIGYKRRYIKGSKLSRIADNILERDFAPNSNLRAQVTASQRGKNSPKLIKQENNQMDKPYHARSMSWLAGTAQRLKRVFNIDINECKKCQRHNVSVTACITNTFVINKILTHPDKHCPVSAQTKLLPPNDFNIQRDFNYGV